MLENFEAQITRGQVDEMVASVMGQMRQIGDNLNGRLDAVVNGLHAAAVNDNPAAVGADLLPDGNRSFSWGGRIHMVPADFSLPPCSVYTVWKLWHHGNPASKISPYKNLHSFDLQKNADKVNLTHIRKVMAALERIIYDLDLKLLNRDRRIASLGPAEANEVFNKSYGYLCSSLYGVEGEDALQRLRIDDKTYNTVYEQMRRRDVALNK